MTRLVYSLLALVALCQGAALPQVPTPTGVAPPPPTPQGAAATELVCCGSACASPAPRARQLAHLLRLRLPRPPPKVPPPPSSSAAAPPRTAQPPGAPSQRISSGSACRAHPQGATGRRLCPRPRLPLLPPRFPPPPSSSAAAPPAPAQPQGPASQRISSGSACRTHSQGAASRRLCPGPASRSYPQGPSTQLACSGSTSGTYPEGSQPLSGIQANLFKQPVQTTCSTPPRQDSKL